MPDPTRTSSGSAGDPDESPAGIQRLAKQLRIVAEIGLRAEALAGSIARLPDLFRLNRTSLGSELARAEALIQLVIAGVRQTPGSQLSDMAVALFGVQERYRDLDYKRRRSHAVDIWDPEGTKDDGSFTRKTIPKITGALAVVMLRLDRNEHLATEGVLLGTAPASDQKKSPGIRRLAVRAETWRTGKGQRPYRSEWRFTDQATRSGVRTVRQFREAKDRHHLEPITESVRKVESLGVDNYGFNVWLVTFRNPLQRDQVLEWGTATVYEDPDPDRVQEADWLSLTVSHTPDKGSIQHATFIVHFDKRHPPKRVVKFVTRKATLPDLIGPLEEVKLSVQGIARAEFDDLQPWFTHGLYWWLI